MSSYNNITKIKYTGNLSDLVSLNEYIVFSDDKAKRKYIIFRFFNNVTQQLLGMEFEVCQYNVDGNLIEKSVVVYNQFLAGAEEAFVPKAKLRVSYKCDTISVRLIQAAFDRFVWKEGEYEDNCYKFEHFFNDERQLGADGQPQDGEQPKPKKEKKEKKEKQPKPPKPSKRPFIMRDAVKKNFARFPVFFNVLVFILIIAFVAGTLVYIKLTTTKFTYQDYNLRVISGDTVAVYGYTGDGTELVIPQTIGKYTVSKIDSGTFKKSKIVKVTFDGEFSIETNAFVNCTALEEVHSTKRLELWEGAFNGCTSLRKVNFVDTFYVEQSVFVNCGLIGAGN